MTVANVNIRKILLKRGNTAQSTSYTGLIGEVTMDTDMKTIRVHDGLIAGGHLIPTQANMQSYANTAVSSGLASVNSNVATLSTAVTTANTAMKSYVDAQITSIVGGAPTVLNTLGEIATALNNDANVASTLTNAISAINSNISNITVPNISSITGDIIPSTDNTYNLGSSIKQWKDLFVNTITTTGNITANSFIGDGSLLTNVASTGDYTFSGTTMDAEEMTIRSTDGDITIDTDSDIFFEIGDNKVFEIVNPDVGTLWSFSTGDETTSASFTLPNASTIVGNTSNNSGSLQWIGNSSGDGYGYTTMVLRPDDTLIGNDQYLVIDPTAPSHIHIRAGGTQDNSGADLFLGGENSHVMIGAGVNPPITITSNNNIWQFDTTGNLTLPSDGYLVVTSGLVTADASPAPIISGFSITNSVGISGNGNISGSNITATGNVSATSFIGDGSQLTGLPASYTNSNVATFLANFGSNNISTTGNITSTRISVSGTGTAINAGSGNILTNKVTGTQFEFLNGLNSVTLTGQGATSVYTLNLPSNAGSVGQVLTTDGSGNLSWTTPVSNYVASDTTGITGADRVTNMVTLTQAEYDAITPNASTVYFIVG